MKVTRLMLTEFCDVMGFDPETVLHIDARPDEVDVTVGRVVDGDLERVTHHLRVDG